MAHCLGNEAHWWRSRPNITANQSCLPPAFGAARMDVTCPSPTLSHRSFCRKAGHRSQISALLGLVSTLSGKKQLSEEEDVRAGVRCSRHIQQVPCRHFTTKEILTSDEENEKAFPFQHTKKSQNACCLGFSHWEQSNGIPDIDKQQDAQNSCMLLLQTLE